MKRTYHFIKVLTVLVIAFNATGCLKDKVNLPKQNEQDYNQVYMPQAVSTPVVSNLLFKSDLQYLVYGANYGGVSYPASAIPVSFAVVPDSVDAYNKRNNTNYPLLPASSYTIDQLSSTIPGGQLATPPLKIAVKTEGALDIFKEYLLPVSVNITGTAAGVKLNKNLSTTYFLVKASLNLSDFTDYDRSNWKVTFFSSQEENGEGPVNGRAALVLDGDINTYWHTRYADYFADPPHILVIDMNEIKTLHGVSFVDRQNQNRGRPMQVTVQTSANGTDWVTSDDFTLQSTNDAQRYFFLSGFKQARYMKLIIKTMYEGATHTHLAEFGAF